VVLAQTTDAPTWALFAATVVLAIATIGLFSVTGVLAFAAIRALRQLRLAVEQLEEVRKDRQTEIFAELGRRWDGQEMTEALFKEKNYDAAQLARLFARGREKRERPRDPGKGGKATSTSGQPAQLGTRAGSPRHSNEVGPTTYGDPITAGHTRTGLPQRPLPSLTAREKTGPSLFQGSRDSNPKPTGSSVEVPPQFRLSRA
jgi:hypothetical protein